MSLGQAKVLRKQMTDAEYRLWYFLRAHRFGGAKFKRQVPIGPYIADFVCFDLKIVVEVDGGQHAGSQHDVRRDDWLGREGFQVLRFWNNDVLRNTRGVLEVMSSALESAARTHPSTGSLRSPPSPTRGEGTPRMRPQHSRTRAVIP